MSVMPGSGEVLAGKFAQHAPLAGLASFPRPELLFCFVPALI